MAQNFRYLKLVNGWQQLFNFTDIQNIAEALPSWSFGTPVIGEIVPN